MCVSSSILLVKDKFAIPEGNVFSVEDETGTEVDKDVFPDLLTTTEICFVIKDQLSDSDVLNNNDLNDSALNDSGGK